MTTTDRATCGYLLVIGGSCRDPRDGKRCTTHNNPRFSICSGCGQDALGECGAGLISGHPCTKPVCQDCNHGPDDDLHRPVTDSTRGPFAAQRPGSGIAGQARAGLVASVVATLDRAERIGMLRFEAPVRDATAARLASLIIDEVTADVFAKMLAGLAAGQASG